MTRSCLRLGSTRLIPPLPLPSSLPLVRPDVCLRGCIFSAYVRVCPPPVRRVSGVFFKRAFTRCTLPCRHTHASYVTVACTRCVGSTGGLHGGAGGMWLNTSETSRTEDDEDDEQVCALVLCALRAFTHNCFSCRCGLAPASPSVCLPPPFRLVIVSPFLVGRILAYISSPLSRLTRTGCVGLPSLFIQPASLWPYRLPSDPSKSLT